MSEAFELIDTKKISKEELKRKFLVQIDRLKNEGVNVKYDIRIRKYFESI
jgi:ABC-type amino acid transport substrate-binding protein